MEDFKKAPIYTGFLFFLAVALQIQVTLFKTNGYAGLRTNLADLCLPFAGLIILISLLRRRSHWPAWNIRHLTWYLATLVLAMTIALWTGYVTNGELSVWALINKYLGFLILLCYFALGGWMVTNARIENSREFFTTMLCSFLILTLAASLFCLLLQKFVPFPLWLGNYAWDGFMANRNAFMMLTLFVMIALEITRHVKNNSLPSWAYNLFWTLMPVFCIYNASRTGWIFGGIILIAIFLIRPFVTLKKILPFIAIGFVLIIGIHAFISEGDAKDGKQFRLLMALSEDDEAMYGGDKKRLIAIEDGIELFRQHNPLTGAGLGSYEEFQKKKRGEFIDIIDFTGLWLLVETGLIGALSLIAFFTICLLQTYKHGFSQPSSLYHRALFLFLLAFAAMSFLHELMYTRYLWFALGLAMAQRKTPVTNTGVLGENQ